MAENRSRPNGMIIGLMVVALLAAILFVVAAVQLARTANEPSDELESTSAFHQNLVQYPAADLDTLPYDAAVLDKLHGGVWNPPKLIQDFEAPSTTGATFRLSDQTGKVVLIYFGYMTCPDFCPATLASLERVQRELGDLADQVQVVMITVDPERDDMERLTAYVGAFDEDFVGLRVEDPAALQTILDQFGVTATRRELEDSALEYLMDHTASVFMVDLAGNWVQRFTYDTLHEDIAADVRLMLERAN